MLCYDDGKVIYEVMKYIMYCMCLLNMKGSVFT